MPRFSEPGEQIIRATYGLAFADLHSLLLTLDDPETREAIEFDLISLGLRLRNVGTDGLSWQDVYTVLRQSPRSSAFFRSQNPEAHEWGLPELLLAEVADAVRVSNWQRGEGKRADYPKPIPRPGVKPTAQTYGKEAIPISDMAEWLGWTT